MDPTAGLGAGAGALELPRLPFCRKAETRDIGANGYHGGDGPVSVTTPKQGNNPLFR